MKTLAALALCVSLSAPAAAQTFVSETEEQYERSQAARQNAVSAFGSGNHALALKGMQLALRDRPTNPALLANALYLAAEVGDAALVQTYADKFAALGLAPGAQVLDRVRAALAPDEWAALEARFSANAAASGRAETLFSIDAAHRLVEGIAALADGSYVVSTVVSGRLLRVAPNRTTSVLLDGRTVGAGSFFGLAYDADEGALYATYGRVDQTPGLPADGARTGVVALDASSGAVLGNWVLPGGVEGQQIADVATHSSGTYVTDGQSGKIYKISGASLTAVPTRVSIRSAQGIAVMDDGMLMVADYGRGLWRIDPNSGDALLLPVPDTLSLIGIDGLFLHKGRLMAIQNGTRPHRLMEIMLNRDRTLVTGVSVLAQALDRFDEPTLGVSTSMGPVFVASSQWPKFAAGGTVAEGAEIVPTRILLVRD